MPQCAARCLWKNAGLSSAGGVGGGPGGGGSGGKASGAGSASARLRFGKPSLMGRR